ncbi:MAG: ImmA/IrrE family metallo-endopeptidase [Acutalibacteraceae bacterium]|nr:ImmA/IrrE family metallo-endopeptidase [Acutalibacteraceae bacterium]
MTNQEIKNKVKDFKKNFEIGDCSYKNLRNATEKQGFIVVEFNHIYNNDTVQALIDALNVSDDILRTNGFTYADRDYRIVFVHEDLNEQEKLLVLAHENGHIFLEHISSQSIIGKDVREEYEANEFTHYLLERNVGVKLTEVIQKHKKMFLCTLSALLLLLVGVVIFIAVNNEQQYYGDYYITATGSKYHEKNCVFVKGKTNIGRLTEEQFESGDYQACKVCLP